MRTNTTTPKESTPKKNEPAAQNTARVCLDTADTIAHLADRHCQPPALVAGSIAELGMEMLIGQYQAKEILGEDHITTLFKVIRGELPRARCSVPILCTDYASLNSKRWMKDLNRPQDVWLGQLIELAMPHFHKPGALSMVLPCTTEAILTTMAHRIREDVEGCPGADELLAPAPKPPSAFIAFEHLLASRGD